MYYVLITLHYKLRKSDVGNNLVKQTRQPRRNSWQNRILSAFGTDITFDTGKLMSLVSKCQLNNI